MRRLSLVIVTVVLAALLQIGEGRSGPVEVRYDNWRLVEADLRGEADLAALDSRGVRVLDCVIGPGRMHLAVPPPAMTWLERSGIAFRVLHQDAQALIDAEAERVHQAALALGGIAGAGVCDASWFTDYRTLDVINARLDELVAEYPALVEKFPVGNSLEFRTIFGLRITGPGGGERPAVLFNGCQHAREWISPAVTMYVATQLLCQYDTNPQVQALVDEIEFIIVPVVNPDGYFYTWPPGDRFWRKNRRNNANGTFGVDLNRNWEFGWGGGGSSSDPGSDTYHGTAAFSEPETDVMRALFEANPNIVATIDFHSFSQLVLSPWGYTFDAPPEADLYNDLGGALADAIQSVHGQNYVSGPASTTLYQASGVSIDWTYGERGAYSFTIELRDEGQNGFTLPPDQIIPTGEENFAAALALAEWVAQGLISFAFPGGLPGIVPAGQSTSVPLTITVVGSQVAPGSAKLYSRLAGGGAFTASDLVPLGGGQYQATLPAAPCGASIEYYFEVQSQQGATERSPENAPSAWHTAQAFDVAVSFADDFEGDLGWTVTNDPGLIDGAWDRGVPAGGGDRGDPATDGDGSGSCYLTDNTDGNSDVDGGSTTLTSPLLDASDPESTINYLRWYSNDFGSNPNQDSMLVQISGNGGQSWVLLEEVSENAGVWVPRSFPVSDYVTPSSQVRIRFIADDDALGSVVEAGVDGVEISVVGCSGGEADLNGDGFVNVQDLVMLITSWGTCAGCPADLNGDGEVNVLDLVILITSWG